jgi:deoxycytidylate deaminase
MCTENQQKLGSELVIGLVAPIGTDLDTASTAIIASLNDVHYSSTVISLSSLLDDIPDKPWGDLPQTPRDTRYNKYMDAGNRLREDVNRGDALAILAVSAIREMREQKNKSPNSPIPRQAYILKSLKHPAEVETLRYIYGPAFILFGAYSPRALRLSNLAKKIADSHHKFQSSEFLSEAQKLIDRDEAEVQNEFGQNVRKVFPLSDFFLQAIPSSTLNHSIQRIIELLFGHPFHTPTREEYAMFHAQASALRSSSLQRQVGAVVATQEGDIISVGTNEVPKAGGGLYWNGDEPDNRDFILGYEISDKLKRRMLSDVLQRLKNGGWLSQDKSQNDIESLAIEATKTIMKNAQLMSIIEFGRCVHAEMAALIDAARRGVSIKECVLFTTTFPCHDCARHIIASGIKKVVYIEPYPKSLASELYPDSITIEGDITSEKPLFCFNGYGTKVFKVKRPFPRLLMAA